MSGLLSVAEARSKLLAAFTPCDREYLPISRSLGRILAADVFAGMDLPPFANSSMDGFAVRTADIVGANQDGGIRLAVVADLSAGKWNDIQLGVGQAARIMTGAPIPAGADAVVPVEITDFNERQPGLAAPAWVAIFQALATGDNIRPTGQDVHSGELVMHAGQRLRPQEIGFLAMLGVTKVEAYKRPRIALFSTGDELAPAEQALQPGQIHDANTYTLGSMIEKYGGEWVPLGIIPDSKEAVKQALNRAVQANVDLILSSAGVSVGAFDFVRSVIEEEGSLGFWRVNMRPGKPLTFGHYQGVPLIGLPGNPVSAFVGFEVFVRPVILQMAGVKELTRAIVQARLSEPVDSDGRESYLRGILKWDEDHWNAFLTGHQGSGNLLSLVQANALLLIASGVKSLPIGAVIEAWLLE